MEKQKRDEKLNTLEGDPINREERSKEGEERERGGAAACAAFAVRPEEQRRKQAQQQRTNQTSTENVRVVATGKQATGKRKESPSGMLLCLFPRLLCVSSLAWLHKQITKYALSTRTRD